MIITTCWILWMPSSGVGACGSRVPRKERARAATKAAQRAIPAPGQNPSHSPYDRNPTRFSIQRKGVHKRIRRPNRVNLPARDRVPSQRSHFVHSDVKGGVHGSVGCAPRSHADPSAPRSAKLSRCVFAATARAAMSRAATSLPPSGCGTWRSTSGRRTRSSTSRDRASWSRSLRSSRRTRGPGRSTRWEPTPSG